MTLAGGRSNREALIDTDGCGPTAQSEKLRRLSPSATGPSMYFEFLQLGEEIMWSGTSQPRPSACGTVRLGQTAPPHDNR
jgi:hypothetical protein